MPRTGLKNIMKFYDQNTLIGTSASNESLLDSIILKKKYKFLSYLFKKKITYRSKFRSFPNPHIRTSSFLINAEIFLDFIDKKKIISKEHTLEIESGRDNLTSYFENNDLKVFVVNSDGNKFVNKDWKFSETYNYFQQSKSIISDKHTRKYNTLNADKNFFHKKKFGVTNHGLKMIFSPFIDLKPHLILIYVYLIKFFISDFIK